MAKRASDPTVELPETVAAVVRKLYPRAKVLRTSIEAEHVIRVYEVKLRARGTDVEVEIAGDGTLMAKEVVLPAARMPRAAARAARRLLAGCEWLKVEREDIFASPRVTVHRPPKVVYEVKVSRDGRIGEIKLSPTGAVLSPLRWKRPAR